MCGGDGREREAISCNSTVVSMRPASGTPVVWAKPRKGMWRRPEELEESRGVTARQSATERSHSGFIDLVVVIGVVEPVDTCSNRR